MVCRNYHGMRSDTHIVPDPQTTMTIQYAERINAAELANLNVASMCEDHRERGDCGLTPYYNTTAARINDSALVNASGWINNQALRHAVLLPLLQLLDVALGVVGTLWSEPQM